MWHTGCEILAKGHTKFWVKFKTERRPFADFRHEDSRIIIALFFTSTLTSFVIIILIIIMSFPNSLATPFYIIPPPNNSDGNGPWVAQPYHSFVAAMSGSTSSFFAYPSPPTSLLSQSPSSSSSQFFVPLSPAQPSTPESSSSISLKEKLLQLSAQDPEIHLQVMRAFKSKESRSEEIDLTEAPDDEPFVKSEAAVPLTVCVKTETPSVELFLDDRMLEADAEKKDVVLEMESKDAANEARLAEKNESKMDSQVTMDLDLAMQHSIADEGDFDEDRPLAHLMSNSASSPPSRIHLPIDGDAILESPKGCHKWFNKEVEVLIWAMTNKRAEWRSLSVSDRYNSFTIWANNHKWLPNKNLRYYPVSFSSVMSKWGKIRHVMANRIQEVCDKMEERIMGSSSSPSTVAVVKVKASSGDQWSDKQVSLLWEQVRALPHETSREVVAKLQRMPELSDRSSSAIANKWRALLNDPRLQAQAARYKIKKQRREDGEHVPNKKATVVKQPLSRPTPSSRPSTASFTRPFQKIPKQGARRPLQPQPEAIQLRKPIIVTSNPL